MTLDFDITQDARAVVIVAMSARSGSSWLVEQLKQSDHFLHFRGELTTFLRLHGLTPSDARLPSEALSAEDGKRVTVAFRDDLSREVGYPLDRIEDGDQFEADILRRLRLQWPDVDFNAKAMMVVSGRVAAELGSRRPFDPISFSRDLLVELATIVPIDPDFYDFGREPGRHVDAAYPFRRVFESPPFLLFCPWRRPTQEDVDNKPVIVKSAGDAYRLDFYNSLFPNAKIYILHLRRNPAASINGLINAWLSKKYQSFHVGGLHISGYSELAPWREDWWKLDLFPGWENYCDASLPEVCCAQWAIAQDKILDWCSRNNCEPIVARYEDMVMSAERRADIVDHLCDVLCIPRFTLHETRVINASLQPRKGAWRDRSSAIMPLLTTTNIQDLCTRLAYGSDLDAWV